MKIKFLFLLFATALARLGAADILSADAAVFLQPDPKSHVLTRLKSGNTIIYTGDAPAGWRRVEITGTFVGYAHNPDITKGMDVREGANILTEPRKDAPILTVSQPGDKTPVTGLVNNKPDWCQISVEKKLQGFIATSANANVPTEAPKPLPAVAAPAAPAGPVTTAGRPVPMTGNTADMPRQLAGRLVLARRPILNPNPLYDYQLVDSNGRRFAYVDTKRLVLTDKIENFLEREITITGTVRNTVDGKDLVVAAESMALAR
ncbi:MAG TPA: SH3 domain-containing protein [Lacunisphaera sp.]|nr:SH3 domain-containing protein [Lacunisphaera sp.]